MTQACEADRLVQNVVRKDDTPPIDASLARTLSPDERHLKIGGPARTVAAGLAAAGEDGPSPSSPFVLALAPGTFFSPAAR
jgi:hypothetical protein